MVNHTENIPAEGLQGYQSPSAVWVSWKKSIYEAYILLISVSASYESLDYHNTSGDLILLLYMVKNYTERFLLKVWKSVKAPWALDHFEQGQFT